MSSSPDFSFNNIARIIAKRKRFVIVFTLAALLTSILCCIFFPFNYKAESVFVLKNPMYGDRNYLYNNETKFIDYFASEEDIDKLISMAEADSIQDKIIKEMNLAVAYQFDTSDAQYLLKIRKNFRKRLSIYRTDSKNIILSYSDKDPNRAADVANKTVTLLENALRGFYNEMRWNIYQSLADKLRDEDSTINVLTDTLSTLRDKYGIYDIISPSRYNLMLSSVKHNGQAGFAKGVEQIQNIESIKDELVSDRARITTLANQYSTGTRMNALPLTHIIKVARPPLKPLEPFFAIVFISTMAGLFFSVLFVLFTSWFSTASIVINEN